MSLLSMGGLGAGEGLLAAAGAVGGAGQAIAKMGADTIETQHKMDLETHMNQLAQAREESIARLQNQFSVAGEKTRFGHALQEKQFELKGQAGIATYKVGQAHKEAAQARDYQREEGAAKRTSEERRAEIYAGSRVESARIRAEQQRKAGPGKEWEVRSEKLPDTFDPTTHQPIGGATVQLQFNHRLGQSFVAVTPDKFMPYVASRDGKLPDPGTTRRVDARAVQDLVNDPMGRTPSGNLKSDVFLQRNGFLPSSYFAAVHNAQGQQSQGGSVSMSTTTRQPARPGQPQTPTAKSPYDTEDESGAPEAPELPDLPGEAGGADETAGDGGAAAYNATAN